ncbi:MAG: phasin family protein [Pseudomonadota bacterium]|nr:phasin family protein [Pseudomonadota bacterium]
MTRTKRTSRTTRAVRTPRKAANVAAKLNGLKASALSTVNALLKQGAALQQKSRKLVIAKAYEAREAVSARADEARTRTVDAVSHLEKVFEGRVSKVISKLGVPTSRDVRAISRQVTQLQLSVEQLRRSRARA